MVEVDQSGKIGEYRDTVVAFRNKEQYSVLLKRKIKNELIEKYKYKKDIKYRLFSILVYYCIKNYIKEEVIFIDREYEGHERDIKKHLLRFIWRNNPNFNKRLIRFTNLGKKSRAHRLAYQTFAGKLAPNKIISKEEVKKLI